MLRNLKTQEVEARGSEVQSHPWLHVSLKPTWATRDPISKKKWSLGGSKNRTQPRSNATVLFSDAAPTRMASATDHTWALSRHR